MNRKRSCTGAQNVPQKAQKVPQKAQKVLQRKHKNNRSAACLAKESVEKLKATEIRNYSQKTFFCKYFFSLSHFSEF